MSKNFQKKLVWIFFLLLIGIGIFFRFYNLNWGEGYYFHPDERQNIAYPILESKSTFLYDQKNFDIGIFPLVVIKSSCSFIGGFLFHLKDPLEQIIVTSRFFTALFSIITALLIYKISNKYFGQMTGLISLFLMLFFVGNIQYSHFGTVEIWEAFFLSLLFYYSLKITTHPSIRNSLLVGILTALSLATKILTLVAVPAIIFSFFFSTFIKKSKSNRKNKDILRIFLVLVVYALCIITITLLLMPHTLFNFTDAYSSIKFESDVALGRLPVFYTQGFSGTIPYFFQLTNVYPFLINPVFSFFLIPSVVYVFYVGIKKRSYYHILTALFFLVIFLSQGHFFAKWTRYYIPTLPFVALLLSLSISCIYEYLLKRNLLPNLFLGLILSLSFFYGLLFFVLVYLQTPSQITALNWAKTNIPRNSDIITEPFDLGIVPFHTISKETEFLEKS